MFFFVSFLCLKNKHFFLFNYVPHLFLLTCVKYHGKISIIMTHWSILVPMTDRLIVIRGYLYLADFIIIYNLFNTWFSFFVIRQFILGGNTLSSLYCFDQFTLRKLSGEAIFVLLQFIHWNMFFFDLQILITSLVSSSSLN
jgi:hypothetical protein